jgi:DNA replication and repair protein RecF
MPRRSLDYEKAMRDRNRLLKDQVTDAAGMPRWRRRWPRRGRRSRANRAAALAGIGAPGAGRQRLSPRRPDPDLPRGPTDAADDLASPGRGPRRDMAAGRTLVGPHRADLRRAMPPRACPPPMLHGEQKALLISLILANARALAEDRARARSCCWTRSPRIWMPKPAARRFMTRSAPGRAGLMTGTGPSCSTPSGRARQFVRRLHRVTGAGS